MADNKDQNKVEGAKARAGKFLTFKLGEEVYGLEILKVQEIIGIMKVTSIPGTPPFIRGVINLRGKIIPVVDLRLKFSMETKEDTQKTCIIVVQIQLKTKKLIMGIVVDEVSEVLNVVQDQIEDPPSFGSSIDTAFIMGMGKVGQKVIMLLDIDKVLSAGDLDAVGNVA